MKNNNEDVKANEMKHEHHHMHHNDKSDDNTHKHHTHSNEHEDKKAKPHNHEHQHLDHSSHMQNLKTKFIVSLILAIPIILMSHMMGIELPFQITFQGSEWVVVVLSTILFFYGGMPFLQGAKMELKAKNPAMMTLISLGISVAYFYSMYAFILNNILTTDLHIMDFFWELATLIVIMLLGHWIEMNAISNAGNALQKMAELLPTNVITVDKEGNTKEVALKDVVIDDIILVKSGDKMPVDGIIIEGSTTVNESMVTGESKEIAKTVNNKVIGGSVNGLGTIKVKVTGIGETSYLAQVMELVDRAQNEKSKAETMSDKIARLLFYVALIISVLAFIVWYLVSKDLNISLERMVTVLIIACPHALGLAIPLVVAKSTSLGAKNGLLIKDRHALEIARKTTVMTMDKTGTLTEGNFMVNEFLSFNQEYSKEDVLQYVASITSNSNHPLSLGIVKKAKSMNLNLLKASDILNLPGIGIEGQIAKQKVKIVNISYLEKYNIEYDYEVFDNLSKQGNSISYLIIDENNIGLVAQGDQIKKESKDLIDRLKKLGIKPVMLTGDNRQVADKVGNELGIKDIHARLLPENKEKIIKGYQDKGNVVMMVGDGINDAPSLVRADIGMAIGAGTDVAVDSADVILVKSNPLDAIHFISLAKNTTRKMNQNLWWGAGYNIVAIPLAAGILANQGIIFSPAIGAIFMTFSTLIVAINAMLLKIDN